MNKKGLTFGTIVTAIIAIIVLILLIQIFTEQIDAIAEKFMDVIKQTDTGTKEFVEDLKNLDS